MIFNKHWTSSKCRGGTSGTESNRQQHLRRHRDWQIVTD
jgi:hypothetical protein